MLFWVVSGVGRRMGALYRGRDCSRGRGHFGVNVGCPIVTNGILWHSCAKLHELIQLSFGVVSGVG